MIIRDILNRLRWKGDANFDEVRIWYIDRGAPNDVGVIAGKDVEKIGKSFIYTKGKAIPFHRVIRITYGDEVLFDRFRKDSPESSS
ncbi:MAG: DUF504 domain-containing protein [Thermoplasmata archaeon]|nr:MAG: DUF504 domain-containing protein [Thermoplasmata archaeon]HDO69554.1 DUF504 domain-containing protein [Thermoplasmatales archaeon]HEX17469.1 DUF504 domain-containing protein [Thermoplasmatales archaeon]